MLLLQYTTEEVIAGLSKQSKGAGVQSSIYRGVTRHQKGRWEARIGATTGRRYQYLVRRAATPDIIWLPRRCLPVRHLVHRPSSSIRRRLTKGELCPAALQGLHDTGMQAAMVYD